MTAELYILSASFSQNSNLNNAEIEHRIQLLAEDFVFIKKYKATNHLLIHHEIYNVKFMGEETLGDLLFNVSLAKQKIGRDTFNALQKIILESASTELNSSDVENLLLDHNETICRGLIAFNKVNQVEAMNQIIYGLSDWFKFRRYFLGLYPRNGKFFIDECRKYFINLFFHDRNDTF
jgi:hypothetical protein